MGGKSTGVRRVVWPSDSQAADRFSRSRAARDERRRWDPLRALRRLRVLRRRRRMLGAGSFSGEPEAWAGLEPLEPRVLLSASALAEVVGAQLTGSDDDVGVAFVTAEANGDLAPESMDGVVFDMMIMLTTEEGEVTGTLRFHAAGDGSTFVIENVDIETDVFGDGEAMVEPAVFGTFAYDADGDVGTLDLVEGGAEEGDVSQLVLTFDSADGGTVVLVEDGGSGELGTFSIITEDLAPASIGGASFRIDLIGGVGFEDGGGELFGADEFSFLFRFGTDGTFEAEVLEGEEEEFEGADVLTPTAFTYTKTGPTSGRLTLTSEGEGEQEVLVTQFTFGTDDSGTMMILDEGDEGDLIAGLLSVLEQPDAPDVPDLNVLHDFSESPIFQTTDAETGAPVTIRLTGPGEGTVSGSGDGRFDRIELSGTDNRSRLTILTRGRQAETSIGDIVADGSLGGITGNTTNLRGDIEVRGELGRLFLRSVTGDRQNMIVIGESDRPRAGAIMRLGSVEDLSITTQTPIRQLIATQWLDPRLGSQTDFVLAPQIGVLRIQGSRAQGIDGDFQADVVLTDSGVPLTLRNMNVAGDVSNSVMQIGINPADPEQEEASGNAGVVTVRGNADDFILVAGTLRTLNIAGSPQRDAPGTFNNSRLLLTRTPERGLALNNMTMAGASGSLIRVDGPAGVVTIRGNVDNVSIIASTLRTLNVAPNPRFDAGGDLNNSLIEATESPDRGFAVGSVRVAGGSTSTLILAAPLARVGFLSGDGDVGSVFVAGDAEDLTLGARSIRSLRLGDVSGESRVVVERDAGVVVAQRFQSDTMLRAGTMRALNVTGDGRTFGGDFDGMLTLTEAPDRGFVLNTANIRDRLGGTFAFSGGVGNIIAGDITPVDPGAPAPEELRPSITAPNIRSINVRGDIADADINLTQATTDPRQPALTNLAVRGDIKRTELRSAGDVRRVTAGGLEGTRLLGGVRPETVGLPTFLADFEDQPAELGVLNLRPARRGDPAPFRGSDIAFARVGTLNLQAIEPRVDGEPFGLAGEEFGRVIFTDAAGQRRVLRGTAEVQAFAEDLPEGEDFVILAGLLRRG